MHTFHDADALVPWAAQNNAALAWEPLEEAVLRGLGGPIPDEYADDPDLPLLRFANTDLPARPLLAAITDPPIPRGKAVCDITGTPLREPNTLWVPCGRSVVQVTMRNSARENLAYFSSSDLVWC